MISVRAWSNLSGSPIVVSLNGGELELYYFKRIENKQMAGWKKNLFLSLLDFGT